MEELHIGFYLNVKPTMGASLGGRPHRKGLEPMFYGDPVGHWEGDTPVVHTTNFIRWALDD